MNSFNSSATAPAAPALTANVCRAAGYLVWQAIRLPALTFLVILEPVVRVVLSTLALLGILATFFFEFSGGVPQFPFWTMLAISLGMGLALIVYYMLMRVLSR